MINKNQLRLVTESENTKPDGTPSKLMDVSNRVAATQ